MTSNHEGYQISDRRYLSTNPDKDRKYLRQQPKIKNPIQVVKYSTETCTGMAIENNMDGKCSYCKKDIIKVKVIK